MTAGAGDGDGDAVDDPATPVAIPAPGGDLPGLLRRPPGARWLYVLAHGAGAGMRHRFLAAIAGALAAEGVATLRFDLPSMAAGRRRPDPPAVRIAAVRAAVAAARALAPDLRLAAGGKSMGGRTTSEALAAAADPAVEAIVFLGFPLHPAREPATTRAAHLAAVAPPMLFLQGTRDALAEPALLRPIVAALPRATLHEVDGADHGFAMTRRARVGEREVIDALARVIAAWLDALPPSA